MAGQFWIGANGNVYATGDNGKTVTDYGKATSSVSHMNQLAGVETQKGSVQGRLINDPNPGGGGGGQRPANVPLTASSSPAAPPPLDTAAVNATQVSIDQLGPLLAAALASEDQKYRNTTSQFDAQQGQQQKTYDDSTVTNTKNYDANTMESVRAGVKGLHGLFSLLRGTGAAGGTAQDWAGDTVAGTTSKDIRGGFDTQQENQGQLDSTLATFLTDLKGKRQQAGDTYENNRRAVTRDNQSTLQDLYQKMAGYFSSAGDTGNASSYIQRASSLTPTIAANSNTQVSAYDAAPVAVKAPEITAFAAPTADASVTSSEGSGGSLGAGIFTLGERRRKDEVAPIVPVGA